jgi:hypothetical protein
VDSVFVLFSAREATSCLRDFFRWYGVDGDSALRVDILRRLHTVRWVDLGSIPAAEFEFPYNRSRIPHLVAALAEKGRVHIRLGDNGPTVTSLHIVAQSDTGMGHTMYFRAFYTPSSGLLFRIGDGETIVF